MRVKFHVEIGAVAGIVCDGVRQLGDEVPDGGGSAPEMAEDIGGHVAEHLVGPLAPGQADHKQEL